MYTNYCNIIFACRIEDRVSAQSKIRPDPSRSFGLVVYPPLRVQAREWTSGRTRAGGWGWVFPTLQGHRGWENAGAGSLGVCQLLLSGVKVLRNIQVLRHPVREFVALLQKT